MAIRHQALVQTLRTDHVWLHANVEAIESDKPADLNSLVPDFGKRLNDHIRKDPS